MAQSFCIDGTTVNVGDILYVECKTDSKIWLMGRLDDILLFHKQQGTLMLKDIEHLSPIFLKCPKTYYYDQVGLFHQRIVFNHVTQSSPIWGINVVMNKIEIRGVEVGLGDIVSVDIQEKSDDKILLTFAGEVVSTQTDIFSNYQKIILCQDSPSPIDPLIKDRMYHHLMCERHKPYLFNINIIKRYEEKPTLPKKCTCDITDMMRYGCRCGGV